MINHRALNIIRSNLVIRAIRSLKLFRSRRQYLYTSTSHMHILLMHWNTATRSCAETTRSMASAQISLLAMWNLFLKIYFAHSNYHYCREFALGAWDQTAGWLMSLNIHTPMPSPLLIYSRFLWKLLRTTTTVIVKVALPRFARGSTRIRLVSGLQTKVLSYPFF